MKKNIPLVLALAAALWLPALAAAQTQGELDACGSVYVAAGATCSVEVEGGCLVQCEPLSFRAACAADLWASCDGGCTGSVTASCTASCDIAGCQARCEANPGSFDCRAQCRVDAEASCSARCSAVAGADAQADCQASCDATIDAECNASCNITAPSVDCQAQCQASCEGACTVDSNLQCQVDCQAGGYAECYATMQGGCEASCQEPSGALFCDGQYVDTNTLDACIAQIEASLMITVEYSSSASCVDGSCMAEASASASCSAAGRPKSAPIAGALVGLGALVLFTRRRRR